MRDDRHRDVIVVGSGFGAAMAARPLIRRGLDVLMLERGSRVARGPRNWAPEETVTRSRTYTDGPSFTAVTGRGSWTAHQYACLGGPSVYYGGVSLRFREIDFRPGPEIVTDSGARWPFRYPELSLYYDRVERILGVTGRAGEDPTEPPREGPYSHAPPPLSEVSRRVAEAARSLGLRPFRLPLAINYVEADDRRTCIECATCDTFACAIEAKNDVEVRVLRELAGWGMELRTDTSVTELLREGNRIVGVSCLERSSGSRWTATADRIVLAGGALGSAQLLLASGLPDMSPAGDAVGRYLTRHCSGITFGAYHWIPRYEGHFHKQIGLNDFYVGGGGAGEPPGPLGNLQQTQTPSLGTVRDEVGPITSTLIAPLVRRITGLLAIAQDRPLRRNRVTLEEGGQCDEHGLPRIRVQHRYADRDLAARDVLLDHARRVHRATGSLASYTHMIDTFSHALGTVRMGPDPEVDPVDGQGRFRGVEGLRVADGSVLPTSGGVNPSLTIAANGLRIGEALAEEMVKEGAGRRGGKR